MRIKTVQESLKGIIRTAGLNPIAYVMGFEDEGTSPLMELIMSAKAMAAELLQDENPKKTLVDALLQIFLIAAMLGIDLEKEIGRELVRLRTLMAGGA